MTPEVLRRARLGDQAALAQLACDRATFALVDALGGFGPAGIPGRPTALQAATALRAWHRANGWSAEGAAVVSPTGGTRLRFRERTIVVQRAERDALGRVRWVRHATLPLQGTLRQLASRRGTCPRPIATPVAANPIRAWFGADRDPVNVTGPAFPGSTTYWSARFQDGEEGYLPAFDLYDRAGRRWLDPPKERTAAWRNPPGGDARLRELERAWRTTGAADDFSRWAQERLRRGEGPLPFQVKAVDLHDGEVRVARGFQASPILAYVVTHQPIEVERDVREPRYVPWVAHLDRRGWFLQPRNGLFDPEPTVDPEAARSLVRAQAEEAIRQPPLYWEDLSVEEQRAMTARRSAELEAVLRRRYPTPAWYDDREWIEVLGPAVRFPPYSEGPQAGELARSPESALSLLARAPHWTDDRPGARRPDHKIVGPTGLRDRPETPPWVMPSARRKDRRGPIELAMARGAAKGPLRGQR